MDRNFAEAGRRLARIAWRVGQIALVRSIPFFWTDSHVGCNDYQFRLPRQRSNPDNVFDIARKTVLEVNDMMFRLHHLIQPAGQFRREVVVEKEFHASSERSKSTASRTETGLTSN